MVEDVRRALAQHLLGTGRVIDDNAQSQHLRNGEEARDSTAGRADAGTMAEERRDAIKLGKLHPYAGPVKDQSGKVFVAAGQTYADADLKKMNFYVEGVQGSIPK